MQGLYVWGVQGDVWAILGLTLVGIVPLALPDSVAGMKLKKVWLPDTLEGENGEYATLWSSVFAGLRLYAAGRQGPLNKAAGVGLLLQLWGGD